MIIATIVVISRRQFWVMVWNTVLGRRSELWMAFPELLCPAFWPTCMVVIGRGHAMLWAKTSAGSRSLLTWGVAIAVFDARTQRFVRALMVDALAHAA